MITPITATTKPAMAIPASAPGGSPPLELEEVLELVDVADDVGVGLELIDVADDVVGLVM